LRYTARTVTALPPTQVSEERLFSALNIIKSDPRGSGRKTLQMLHYSLKRTSEFFQFFFVLFQSRWLWSWTAVLLQL